MKLLDGRELAGYIKERQVKEVRRLKQAHGVTPKFAIVRDHPVQVSDVYLKLKRSYGQDIGVEVAVHDETSETILACVGELNQDPSVHGIIVQLPLADPETANKVLNAIEPAKDVDGLGGKSAFDPATPTAILWLLSGYGVELAGKKVAVVGQGRLVGAPMARMLEESGIAPAVFDENSTDMTESLPEMDVIITATGQPGLITGHMVQEGAVVVDAGTASEGGKVKGDAAQELYARDDITITPVKGGVGPLTVAALFDNVLRAARATISP